MVGEYSLNGLEDLETSVEEDVVEDVLVKVGPDWTLWTDSFEEKESLEGRDVVGFLSFPLAPRSRKPFFVFFCTITHG